MRDVPREARSSNWRCYWWSHHPETCCSRHPPIGCPGVAICEAIRNNLSAALQSPRKADARAFNRAASRYHAALSSCAIHDYFTATKVARKVARVALSGLREDWLRPSERLLEPHSSPHRSSSVPRSTRIFAQGSLYRNEDQIEVRAGTSVSPSSRQALRAAPMCGTTSQVLRCLNGLAGTRAMNCDVVAKFQLRVVDSNRGGQISDTKIRAP
jgi:hypothetical protein